MGESSGSDLLVSMQCQIIWTFEGGRVRPTVYMQEVDFPMYVGYTLLRPSVSHTVCSKYLIGENVIYTYVRACHR